MNMNMLPITMLCCAALAAVSGAAGAGTNAAPVRPKSVFVDDLAFGRDPFFPNSTRRSHSNTVPTTNAVIIANLPLSLKGISGSKPPFALINNATLSEGEAVDIRVGRETYKIRCTEIRDRSVFIEVVGTGRIHELKLRDGI